MTQAFLFGPYKCAWSEAFFLSKQSLALVNLKPIVPGHVLVISRRVAPLFNDLTADEVSDLWKTAHTIGPKIREHFGAQALTYAIQDGKVAGQTVPHVHIHILPRKPGDFERNDQVYDELEKASMERDSKVAMDADEDRKPRSLEEMAAESATLRKLFVEESLTLPTESS